GASRSITLGARPAWITGFGPSHISIFTSSLAQMPVAPGASETVESLWFGGWDLFALVGKRWYVLGASAGLPQVRLHAVVYDEEGYLWVSTQGEGLFCSTEPVTVSMLEDATLSNLDLPSDEGGVMHASVVRQT